MEPHRRHRGAQQVVPTIAIISDVHLGLTSSAEVGHLLDAIDERQPDVLVLAGDNAEGPDRLERLLTLMCERKQHRLEAVLVGNHDLWCQGGVGSAELWTRILPGIVHQHHMMWLERDIIELPELSVVGSIAWYDYSAGPEGVAETDFAKRKREFVGDGDYISWKKSDVTFAREVGDKLLARIRRCRTSVPILVVTHVPLFDRQIIRRPEDLRWTFSNAYYGNLTLGREVMKDRRVVAVVSGHTHHTAYDRMIRDGAPDLHVAVVGSTCNRPGALVLTITGDAVEIEALGGRVGLPWRPDERFDDEEGV